MFAAELKAWMTEMRAEELATRLTGAITAAKLPKGVGTVVRRAPAAMEFVIEPLPNSPTAPSIASHVAATATPGGQL